MSQKTVHGFLVAAVAAAGTFTAQYPEGTTKNTFLRGVRHQLVVAGATFEAPGKFSLTFNAADITVTLGATMPTLAAGSEYFLGIDTAGEADYAAPLAPRSENVRDLKVLEINFGSPDTADADGVCASQTVTFATTPLAVLDGALVGADDIAVFDVPRAVVAAWTGTAVLTMTAIDEFGVEFTEASGSGTSFAGKKAAKKVTAISMSANVTGLTVGTGDVLGSPVVIPNTAHILRELQDGVALAGQAPTKIQLPFSINQTDLLAPTAAELIAPCAGYISMLKTTVQVAVTTGGAITVEVATVAVTGLSITVADAATKGTVQSDTPTTPRSATTLVAAGDRITITPAAAFATAGAVNGYLEIEPIAAANGTLVAQDVTAPAATTGDVRGTYVPSVPCDGSKGFSVLVAMWDANDRGLTQYAA